jgi:hypothetical protein
MTLLSQDSDAITLHPKELVLTVSQAVLPLHKFKALQ